MNVLLKYRIAQWIIYCMLSVTFPGSIWGQIITAKVDLDTNRALIGDQLKILLVVEKPENVTVSFPDINDELSKEITVIRKSDIDTSLLSEGLEKLRQELLIAVFDTGIIEIPALEFIYQYLQTQDTIRTRPQVLEIESIPLESDIRDIKANYKAPITLLELLPYVIALVVIVAAILLIRLYYKRKYRGMSVSLASQKLDPPDVVALRELERLRKETPWLHNKVKVYYIRLSEIIRNYIERRYLIPALEQTTEEILRDLKVLNYDSDSIPLLKEMLTLADLVKFAKVIPDKEENVKQIEVAVEYVIHTSSGPLQDRDSGDHDTKTKMLQKTNM